MGYSIVFETKIVTLSDGRLLHFDLSGCNNDDCGRSRDEFNGKIYTKDNFIKYAEGFKKDGKSAKESNSFELKIGNRYCTMYDYGEHLLRMLKRSITFDELRATRICYGKVYDGVELREDGKQDVILSPDEWDKICYDFMYGKRKGQAFIKSHKITKEKEIIESLENGERVSFYIGKAR